MHSNYILYKHLSDKLVNMAFKIHSQLGPGLIESVYENAFVYELKKNGLFFERQKQYQVMYEGVCIGSYYSDLVVEDKIILELKSVDLIHPFMKAQLIHYLKISGLKVGYLINFRSFPLYFKRLRC